MLADRKKAKLAIEKKRKAEKIRIERERRAKQERRDQRAEAKRKRKAAREEAMMRARRSKLRQGMSMAEIEAEEVDAPVEESEEEVSSEEEQEQFYGIGDDGKMGECHYCKDGGELLCCDGCEKVFHFECLVPPMRQADMPEGDWFCDFCTAESNGAPAAAGDAAAATTEAASASTTAQATASTAPVQPS
uniref:PHD-type domain-containing protein n=1 Tax=Haptolina ericina TaxID=156174 RepID=A0A6T9GNG7_9EUKA